jgi:ABC-2 type transport system ATP-binding protein
LRRPPADDALLALPGVAAVEESEGLLRVQFADGAAGVPEAIVQAAVAGDWGLYQIAPDVTSLEDVFLHLTQQEEALA